MSRAREAQFEAFVAGATTRLLRDAYACTGDWHESKDLVQEAFVKTYRAWRRIRNDDPYSYTRTILIRTYIDHSRRARTKRELVTDAPPERITPELGSETRIDLITLLACLPSQQRATVVLRYLEDLSTSQTAHALGVTEGTVKSQLHAALAKLREMSSPDEGLANQGRRNG